MLTSSQDRYALLVVDMQNDMFLDPRLAGRKEELRTATNRLIGIFRARTLPILLSRQAYRPDLSNAPLSVRATQRRVTIDGTEGAAFLDGLDVRSCDHVSTKTRYSAFFGTELLRTLYDLQISTIVMTGVNTHACVRCTAIDAYQHDLRVIFAAECIASYDDGFHEESQRYLSQSIGPWLSNEAIQARIDVVDLNPPA